MASADDPGATDGEPSSIFLAMILPDPLLEDLHFLSAGPFIKSATVGALAPMFGKGDGK